MIDLPVFCRCGQVVTYAGAGTCEDCYVNNEVKRDRLDQRRIQVPHLSAQQREESERRQSYINKVFAERGSAPYVPARIAKTPSNRLERT